MHEVGIVIEIIKSVEKIVTQQNLSTVDTLVLQVGELSSVVPHYLEACYPAAVDGTFMEKTQLVIERIPGNAMCQSCHKVYRYLDHKDQCPYCQKEDWKLISGREFMIKEIIAM